MGTSRLSRFCEHALEAGWLIGVALTPLYFNAYSSRVFEPDKTGALRAVATVMAALWLVRYAAGRLFAEGPFPFSWRTPLVLPALATMVTWLVASVCSLAPAASFLGSFERAEGFATLLSNLVLFFAIVSGLRTRVQLARLLTVLIGSSVPVALYAILQDMGLDPLTWTANVQSRPGSTMGNPLFAAAYLTLLIPLTGARLFEAGRDLASGLGSRLGNGLRTGGYALVLLGQLVACAHAESRGPTLGLLVAAFLLPLLGLLRLQHRALQADDAAPGPRPLSDLAKGLGFGVGVVVLCGLLAALCVGLVPGPLGGVLAAAGSVVVFAGAWLTCLLKRIGWRWLWAGWVATGLTGTLLLAALNVPGPLRDAAVTQLPALGRLTELGALESGSGRVRVLLWQTAMESFSAPPPLPSPDGGHDALRPIRWLVGFGPDALSIPYTACYPPELGRYELRTNIPDRAHNETLDALAGTGVLGLLAYLLVFGSVLSWGLRWLGFLHSRRAFMALGGLWLGCALAAWGVGGWLAGPYVLGIAVPLGFVLGTLTYLCGVGLRAAFRGARAAPGPDEPTHPHAGLLMAILALAVGHLVETNLGIAIAATRATFWVALGLLVVLGRAWVPGADRAPAPPTPDGPPRFEPALLALSLAATFLLATLAFDFTGNPAGLSEPGAILWGALTVLPASGQTSYGVALLFVATWFVAGLVGLGELAEAGLFAGARARRWLSAAFSYLGITGVGWLAFSWLLASHHANLPQGPAASIGDAVAVALATVGILGHYYGLLFVWLALLGGALLAENPLPRAWGSLARAVLLAVTVALAALFVRWASYDPSRADMLFKQATLAAETSAPEHKPLALALAERVIAWAPYQDRYFMFRAKTHGDWAQTLADDSTREAELARTAGLFEEARRVRPLNPDHTANLGRFYRNWGVGTADARARAERLDKAVAYYRSLLTLSPRQAILWNELAVLQAVDRHDLVGFEAAITRSLELDPAFVQSWLLLGDVLASQNELAGAGQAYRRVLGLDANHCLARRQLGNTLAKQGLWDEVVSVLEPARTLCAAVPDAWDDLRVLAIAYASLGRAAQAVQTAEEALRQAPADRRGPIADLIAAVQQRAPQPSGPPPGPPGASP